MSTITYGDEAKPRMGFFTDTSVCIGCKACEVACKEWNVIPEDGLDWTGESYDNTGELSANTWRHVAFIEQEKPLKPSISIGIWFHSLQATSHALQPMHTDVSVKKPIRGFACSP